MSSTVLLLLINQVWKCQTGTRLPRIHTYLCLKYSLTYSKIRYRTGSNETRDIEDSQDALFGLFYFLIFIISLNRLRSLIRSLAIIHLLNSSLTHRLYYDQPNYKGITGGRTINRNNNSEIAIFYTLISCAGIIKLTRSLNYLLTHSLTHSCVQLHYVLYGFLYHPII